MIKINLIPSLKQDLVHCRFFCHIHLQAGFVQFSQWKENLCFFYYTVFYHIFVQEFVPFQSAKGKFMLCFKQILIITIILFYDTKTKRDCLT